jgi:hypothetical protein
MSPDEVNRFLVAVENPNPAEPEPKKV